MSVQRLLKPLGYIALLLLSAIGCFGTGDKRINTSQDSIVPLVEKETGQTGISPVVHTDFVDRTFPMSLYEEDQLLPSTRFDQIVLNPEPELIVLNEKNELGITNNRSEGFISEIYMWDEASGEYVREWPDENSKFVLLSAFMCDVDHDGEKEIIALVDPDRNITGIPRLRIYKSTIKSSETNSGTRSCRQFDLAAQEKIYCNDLSLKILDVQEKKNSAEIIISNSGRYEKYEFRNGALFYSESFGE